MSTLAFDDVVVPMDGSDCAEAALDAAVGLADRTGARLHVVSVVNPYVLSKTTELEDERHEARATVDGGVAHAEDAGVDAAGEVLKGVPHEEITDYVDEHGADAVVMGTHGRSGVKRVLLGSTAENVVRSSTVPVFTVHGEEGVPGGAGRGNYERVLLPTDGSDAAEPAEDVAVSFASTFDAALDVLSVVDSASLATSTTPDVGGIGGLGESTVTAVEDHLEALAERAVDTAREKAEAAGVDADGDVVVGRPHERILERAEETEADVIVIGTHGRGGIERFVLGSVAEKVVRLAERPVLVVPSVAAEADADATDADATDADGDES
ncbi:universal stress protein [Halobaculum sp. P14]|uniref:universal stress protein n=1 Tax=Halobaculum sp. P14 TaxID=3421638 RepID=UPI003EBC23E9